LSACGKRQYVPVEERVVGQAQDVRSPKSNKKIIKRKDTAVLKPESKSIALDPTFKSKWVWPVKGKVIRGFIPSKGQKGIDIAVSSEQAVLASRAGKVIFVGSGIKGYGKLLIIKHANDYVSAYGGNEKVFVSEGETVQTSQKVAVMGLVQTKSNVLHFEIRLKGKAVDPMLYL